MKRRSFLQFLGLAPAAAAAPKVAEAVEKAFPKVEAESLPSNIGAVETYEWDSIDRGSADYISCSTAVSGRLGRLHGYIYKE